MVTLVHPRKLSLFVALSLADLVLTWFLLGRAGGPAYESNPLAAWWLAQFGWVGLAGFKLGTVLLVAAVALVVSCSRPHTAGRVLTFACATLLAVLLYSSSLVSAVETEAAQFEQVQEETREAEGVVARRRAYAAVLDRLRDDLIARRCTLMEAAQTLADTEYVQGGDWLRSMKPCYPSGTINKRLAAHLISYTLLFREGGPEVGEPLARNLDGQFRSCFGRPAPYLPRYREEAMLIPD